MTQLVLVDDHDMVLNALARMLASYADFQIVGLARCAESCWDLLSEQAVDVLITDLDLPGQTGGQLAQRVLERDPQQGIVVVSYRVEPAEVLALLRAGVRGYVPKSAAGDELVLAIRAVAQGQHYYANHVASAMAEAMRGGAEKDRAIPLSARQRTILQHMSRGLTTRQIAYEMCLSPKTIEKQRGQIMKRLQCRNQIQTLEAARRLQLVD